MINQIEQIFMYYAYFINFSDHEISKNKFNTIMCIHYLYSISPIISLTIGIWKFVAVIGS